MTPLFFALGASYTYFLENIMPGLVWSVFMLILVLICLDDICSPRDFISEADLDESVADSMRRNGCTEEEIDEFFKEFDR